MSDPIRKVRTFLPVMIAAFLLTPVILRAQTVNATLSQDFAAISQPVILNITVTDGRATELPSQIPVEGLDIRFAGTSNNISIVNFQTTTTAIYSYQVLPLATGDFTIPSIRVKMGNKVAQTKPLKLRVGGNAGGVPVLPALPVGPGRGGAPNPYGNPYSQGQQMPQQQQAPQQQVPPQQSQQPSPERMIYGELVIPKKTAYVGEVVPVELRFYFASNVPIQDPDMPTFGGDGFTVAKFAEPDVREQEINGIVYNVVVFQSAITPVKAGDLDIPAAKMGARVRVPMQAPQGMDDFFSNFLANSGFGMELRDVEVKTKPTKLTVKPLPTDGRPDDFSGAIGQFTLRATATPKQAAAGDPISLDVTVAGRGNFDAITAPPLMDAESWKSYPPNESFRASASDAIGYNGEKTFKYAIVARTDATLTPAPEFSFFDPAVEKYVTLRAGPIAVQAKGGGAVAAATAVTAATPPAATPTPTATPAAPTPSGSGDMLMESKSGTFEPFALSRGFLMANAVALLLLLILCAFGMIRALTRSSFARRSARRRESRKLLDRVGNPSLAADEFFLAADTFIRASLAPEGSTLDTRELIAAADLTPETREGVLAILHHGDAWRYSSGGSDRLGAEERQRFLTILKAFDEEIR